MPARPATRPTVEPDGALVVPKPRPTLNDFAASGLAGAGLVLVAGEAFATIADGLAVGGPARATAAGVGIGGLVAAALGVAVDAARAPRGHWRLDADGAEFRGADGSRRGLRWDEVERVQSLATLIRLAGRSGRLRVDRGGLDEEGWRVVRDRVDAALAGRFDREPPPRDGRLRPLVVLALAAPLVAAAAAFARALPHLTMAQVYAGVWVMAALLGMSTIAAAWSVHRDHARRTWRHPRPENGPAAKIVR